MASLHRAPQIPCTGRLAAETGLDATFVVADVAELPANLKGRDFDMGEIVTSLAAAGLRIEFMHEHPWVPWQMFPCMVETEPGSGVWRLPEPYDQRLPVLYSLKAAKD
jgi:hypothetical protein